MKIISKKEIQLKYLPEPNVARIETQPEHEDLIITYPIKKTAAYTEPESAQIKFLGAIDYRFGQPNDEGFHIFYKDSFDYPSLGFELDKLYEVEGLLNEFGNKNARKLEPQEYRHFIFFVKEGTFECIAQNYEIL